MNQIMLGKYNLIILLPLLFVVSCSTIQNKNSMFNTAGQYISVTDFGAVGDGKADDTNAIRLAIAKATEEGLRRKTLPGGIYKGRTYITGGKNVIFPQGMYKISSTIKLPRNIHIKGDESIIFPSDEFANKEQPAFEGKIWIGSISDLQFVSFKNALRLDNQNIDNGIIRINNCSFLENGTAITINNKSSITEIRNSRFLRNDKSLIIEKGEKVIVSKSWIRSGTLTGLHDCQIENYGVLKLEEVVLVPNPPKDNAVEPAWINNYNCLHANGIRQGGEKGSFTLVNNFAKADERNNKWDKTLIIENSHCYAIYGNQTGEIQPAAVRLIEIPNLIKLNSLAGFTNASVIDISKNVNKTDWISEFRAPSKYIDIQITNITGTSHRFKNGKYLPPELHELNKQ